jgi:hypothetical protein
VNPKVNPTSINLLETASIVLLEKTKPFIQNGEVTKILNPGFGKSKLLNFQLMGSTTIPVLCI